ncbi:MAG: DUF6291 domain-containing protein [Rikenellaceae bacterium]
MSSDNRKQFTFYISFFEAINDIEPEEQLPIYRAIAEYAFFQKEPEVTGVGKIIWRLIRPVLDSSHQRFINGCKGGAPKGNTNAQKQPKNNQETTERQPNPSIDKEKDKDIDKDKENIKRTAKRFTPPTLDEVRDYITQKGYTINSQSFIDYYTSNGWRVGKNPMKNWKAAVSSWNSRDDSNRASTVQTTQKSQQYDEL